MMKSVRLLLVLVFLTASCIIVAKPTLSPNENSWTAKVPATHRVIEGKIA
jgi:hypothetical protein